MSAWVWPTADRREPSIARQEEMMMMIRVDKLNSTSPERPQRKTSAVYRKSPVRVAPGQLTRRFSIEGFEVSRGRGGRGSYPLWVLNWIFGLFKRGECPVKGATSKWKRRNQRGPARRVGLVARVNGEVE